MNISLEWQRPVSLHDGTNDNFIYKYEPVEILEEPGIYIFARKFGNSIFPLYIGKALNLKKRIEQQLNNTTLMMGVKNSPSGNRLLLLAVLKAGRAKIDKKLNIVESAYIENALSEGHDLLNKKGTKIRVHNIDSVGPKKNHRPFPRKVKHKAK